MYRRTVGRDFSSVDKSYGAESYSVNNSSARSSSPTEFDDPLFAER
jgi:hypothetical protein